MHSTFYNSFTIHCKIEPVSSLLIKSGTDSIDPTTPEMNFVRMKKVFHLEEGAPTYDIPYLPGSSIKGYLNSAYWMVLSANQLLRDEDTRSQTQKPDFYNVQPRFKGNAFTYKYHDALERTFGSTNLKGRFSASDFLPWKHDETVEKNKVLALESIVFNERTGNAIDKHTGACLGKALFDLEVIDSGEFYGLLQFYNYQLWQLHLFAFLLPLINEGFLRLGASKTRGLGHIKLTPLSIKVMQKELKPGNIALNGLGKYLSKNEGLIKPEKDQYASNLIDQENSKTVASYQQFMISQPEEFFKQLENEKDYFNDLQNSNLKDSISRLWDSIQR